MTCKIKAPTPYDASIIVLKHSVSAVFPDRVYVSTIGSSLAHTPVPNYDRFCTVIILISEFLTKV